MTGITVGDCRHFFRRSLRDDFSAATAAFRTKVDDMIGDFDDIQIMLDDDYGVACVRQLLQDVDQLLDIDSVQASGGFVQDV